MSIFYPWLVSCHVQGHGDVLDKKVVADRDTLVVADIQNKDEVGMVQHVGIDKVVGMEYIGYAGNCMAHKAAVM